MMRNITYHFEEAVQKARELLVSIDLGDFVRLLSVAVAELSGEAGVRQVDQPSAELFEAELSGEMDQRRQLELLVH